MIVGLYVDWYVLNCRKNLIVEKSIEYEDYAAIHKKKELELLAELQKKLKKLTNRSAHLKGLYKKGLLSQTEYMRTKKSIREERTKLIDESSGPGPFEIHFHDEL